LGVGITDAITRRNALLGQGGSVLLNLQYPDEFELYVFALEVVDKNFKTLQYFIFPINPSNFSESKPEITNVKKTSGGITVLTNPNFVPIDITMSGNFGGKAFKVLIGDTSQNLYHNFTDPANATVDYLKLVQNVFDNDVKTGYGLTKILENIVSSLKITDQNSPRKLIFYNLSRGTTYFVVPMSLSFSQSQESNMIWNYTLQLKAVADAKNLVGGQKLKSDKQLVLDSYAQKQVQSLLTAIDKIKLPI
jgi:hypothetical protein